MRRRYAYERAFRGYLRSRGIPHIAVDEARKTLLPTGGDAAMLKSFDFVVYGRSGNLLVDVKGRRIGPSRAGRDGRGARAPGRMESWVTDDDVESLARWERLFGPGFEAVFVFVYECHSQPPDALFEEIFEHAGRWYVLRCMELSDYVRAMKRRSPRWRTVDVPAAAFAELSRPFALPGADRSGRATDAGPLEALLEPIGSP